MKKLIKYIGLAGVDENENEAAQRWGKYFNILMMGAVVWLVFQWHYEFTNQLSFDEAWQGNFIVWLFFLTETLFLSLMVTNKTTYLKSNWLNLVIILVGLPLLLIDYGPMITILRGLRVFFIIGLLVPWLGLSIKFLTDNRLDTTLFAGVIILLFAAVLIVEIDPNINSIKEGIWWAWVTISTVGYGDVVPTSNLGRLFASILILIGLGLFSVITANFAAILIQRDTKEKAESTQQRWQQGIVKLDEIHKNQLVILNQLEELSQKVNQIDNAPPLPTSFHNIDSHQNNAKE